jgi:hypothetical protein
MRQSIRQVQEPRLRRLAALDQPVTDVTDDDILSAEATSAKSGDVPLEGLLSEEIGRVNACAIYTRITHTLKLCAISSSFSFFFFFFFLL